MSEMTTGVVGSLKWIFVLLISTFFLSGCFTAEKYEFTLDLTNNTTDGFIINIGSDVQGKDAVEADFRQLLKPQKPDDDEEYLSQELYESNGQLNFKAKIKFTSLEKMLKFLDITVDREGSYYVVLGKNLHEDISGNGSIKETPEGPVLWWPKETKMIKLVKIEKQDGDASSTSLLKQWQEWKAQQNK